MLRLRRARLLRQSCPIEACKYEQVNFNLLKDRSQLAIETAIANAIVCHTVNREVKGSNSLHGRNLVGDFCSWCYMHTPPTNSAINEYMTILLVWRWENKDSALHHHVRRLRMKSFTLKTHGGLRASFFLFTIQNDNCCIQVA